MKQIFAIAKLTLISSIRFKVFISLVILLCAVVLFLPLVIQSDGTIKGQIQIVLEYTLGFIGFILSLSTIWLMCASFSNEYQFKTIYMLTTKPIRRFKILIGKVLGVMVINFLALLISSILILTHIWFIANDKNIKAENKEILNNEVLVARKVVGRIEKNTVAEPLKIVSWHFNGIESKDTTVLVFMKFRFFLSEVASVKDVIRDVNGEWYVDETKIAAGNQYHPGSFYELKFPYSLVKNGKFTLKFVNKSVKAVTFPSQNIEILVKSDSFIFNYLRVIAIDLFLCTLLSIIAVVSSVFMSFQVATFFTLTFYLVSNLVTFLKSVVAKAIIFSTGCGCSDPAHHHQEQATLLDEIMRFFLKSIILIFPDLKSFNVVDNLVLGKIVSWQMLGHSFAVLILLYGGIIFLLGSIIFSRKEIALSGE